MIALWLVLAVAQDGEHPSAQPDDVDELRALEQRADEMTAKVDRLLEALEAAATVEVDPDTAAPAPAPQSLPEALPEVPPGPVESPPEETRGAAEPSG